MRVRAKRGVLGAGHPPPLPRPLGLKNNYQMNTKDIKHIHVVKTSNHIITIRGRGRGGTISNS